uniref:Uncharacterized protein n=1 Tax=Magallana gigas TaxID=29159 RepID=K1QXB9_MAGGI
MSSGANNKNSTIRQLSRSCGMMCAERKRERERKIKKEVDEREGRKLGQAAGPSRFPGGQADYPKCGRLVWQGTVREPEVKVAHSVVPGPASSIQPEVSPGSSDTIGVTPLHPPNVQGDLRPHLLDLDPPITPSPSNSMPGGPVRPTYQPTSQACSYCPTSSTNQPQDPASVNQGQLVDLPHAIQIVDSQPQASLAQPSPAPGNSNSMPGYAVPTLEASSQPYSPEGEGSRIAQVQPQYHEPLSGEPHLLGDHSYIPTPIATYGSSGDVQLPVVRYNPQDYAALPASSSHPTVRNRPRYKDLRYDGKCNLKAFLHKFVRQQWNETEQHDQFCFFLEGPAIEYYTLMLETTPA